MEMQKTQLQKDIAESEKQIEWLRTLLTNNIYCPKTETRRAIEDQMKLIGRMADRFMKPER